MPKALVNSRSSQASGNAVTPLSTRPRINALRTKRYLLINVIRERCDFLPVAVGDFASGFVEQAGDFQLIRKFRQGEDRLGPDAKFNISVGRFTAANALEPVSFMLANILGIQIRELFGVYFPEKFILRNDFEMIAN